MANNPKLKEVGEKTRFSAERQPDHYRGPKSQQTWKALAEKVISEDRYVYFEKAEELDDNKQPTGRIVRVRVTSPTKEVILRASANKAAKGDAVATKLILEVTGALSGQKASDAADQETIDRLKDGDITAREVIDTLGERGIELVVAAGKTADIGKDSSTEASGDQSTDSA